MNVNRFLVCIRSILLIAGLKLLSYELQSPRIYRFFFYSRLKSVYSVKYKSHWTSKGYMTEDNRKIRSYIAFMDDTKLLHDLYSSPLLLFRILQTNSYGML